MHPFFGVEKTSLKSQKFTWPLAYVYISFVKLRKYLFVIFSCFIKKIYIFKILYDFSCFIHNLECFITFLKKYIFMIFQDFSCFIQYLEWYFITFSLKTIHVLSMTFIKFSRFLKIFQDFSRFFMFYLRSWMIFFTFYKENIHVLLMIWWIFQDFQDFSRFFMNFEDFSWFFFSTFYFCSPFCHDYIMYFTILL